MPKSAALKRRNIPPERNAAYDNEIVCFPLTVDSDLSAKAQDIIRRTCGKSVRKIKLEQLINKHQTKIWVNLKAAVYRIALHALIIGLPAAELGSVTHNFVPQITR